MTLKFRFKLSVVGDGNVGKTTLIIRYTEKRFRESYIPTIGVQWTKKELIYDGAQVNLILWDVAGQNKFREVRSRFYAGSNAAIIVFDVTNLISFDHVENWYYELKRYCGDIPFLLLGNKIDLVDERIVTTDIIEPITKKLNLPYFETSAKTGENVIDMFNLIIKKIKNSDIPVLPQITQVQSIPNIDLKSRWMILEELIQKNETINVINKEFKEITNEMFKMNPYHQKLEEMTRWRLEKLNPYPNTSNLSSSDRQEFLNNLEIWKKTGI